MSTRIDDGHTYPLTYNAEFKIVTPRMNGLKCFTSHLQYELFQFGLDAMDEDWQINVNNSCCDEQRWEITAFIHS